MKPKHKHEKNTTFAKHLSRLKQDIMEMQRHITWLIADYDQWGNKW